MSDRLRHDVERLIDAEHRKWGVDDRPTLAELVDGLDQAERRAVAAVDAAEDAWHTWEILSEAAVIAAYDLANARHRYETWRSQAAAT